MSSGYEGDLEGTGDRLTVLEPIGNQAQSKRLGRGRRRLLRTAIGGHARQRWNVGQPAAISLAMVLDGKREAVARSFFQLDPSIPRLTELGAGVEGAGDIIAFSAERLGFSHSCAQESSV